MPEKNRGHEYKLSALVLLGKPLVINGETHDCEARDWKDIIKGSLKEVTEKATEILISKKHANKSVQLLVRWKKNWKGTWKQDKIWTVRECTSAT